MSDIEKAYQATPAATLEQQITDPNFPKNEREWWAAARIRQLETGLWDVHAYCNNWDWFIWMWPIRKIKRIARAALEDRT